MQMSDRDAEELRRGSERFAQHEIYRLKKRLDNANREGEKARDCLALVMGELQNQEHLDPDTFRHALHVIYYFDKWKTKHGGD